MGNRDSDANPRLGYLDALRGIAASSVALKHHLLVFGIPPSLAALSPYLPNNFYYDGSPEVSFFFVLSGFVLSAGYFDGRNDIKQLSLWRTYVARASRIYPAFLAIFVLSLFGKDWAYTNPAGEEHLRALNRFWPSSLEIEDLWRQLTLLPFSPRGEPIVSPDWTLILEVKYSLLLPFLLIITKYKGRIWLAFITALLIGLLGQTDYLLCGFVFGILLASWYQPLKSHVAVAKTSSKLFLACAIVGLYYLSPWIPVSRTFTASLAGAMVLCFAFTSKRTQKILQAGPLRYLGRVSYSIYLSHFFVLLCFTPYLRSWLRANEVAGEYAWDITLFTVACILLSSLLYFFAEVPGIWLGRLVRQKQ